MNGLAMFIHHAVIKQNVCPTDQANLHISGRVENEFSREHGLGASLFRDYFPDG